MAHQLRGLRAVKCEASTTSMAPEATSVRKGAVSRGAKRALLCLPNEMKAPSTAVLQLG